MEKNGKTYNLTTEHAPIVTESPVAELGLLKIIRRARTGSRAGDRKEEGVYSVEDIECLVEWPAVL